MTLQKAICFAAGRGERLKPLTDKTPKPLLPIGGHPLIDYTLHYLKRFGLQEVMINLHHLGEKIEQYVGSGAKYGLKIFYSKEEKLLGTGGGLKRCEHFFQNEEMFLTLNADTLIDCDLKALVTFQAQHLFPATLVVAPWQEGYTRLQCGNGRLLNIGGGDYLFTGLALWNPIIFSKLSLKPSNLILDGLQPLMQEVKTVGAFVHEGYWRDIGTPQNYKQVQEEWAASHQQRFP